MEDIVPGYNDAKESLFTKLQEPMEQYILTKLKIQQLVASHPRLPSVEKELKDNMIIHARQVHEILLSDSNE